MCCCIHVHLETRQTKMTASRGPQKGIKEDKFQRKEMTEATAGSEQERTKASEGAEQERTEARREKNIKVEEIRREEPMLLEKYFQAWTRNMKTWT